MKDKDSAAPDDETAQNGMYDCLDNEQMKVLLDCLRESHDFAKAFNANHKLRTALWKAGKAALPAMCFQFQAPVVMLSCQLKRRLADTLAANCAGFMKQLPNLLKQETSSLHASLGVLYRMYDDKTRESYWDDVETRLFRFASQIMSSFLVLQV